MIGPSLLTVIADQQPGSGRQHPAGLERVVPRQVNRRGAAAAVAVVPTRGQREPEHAMSNLLCPSVLGPGLEDKVIAVHELAAALGNAVRNREDAQEAVLSEGGNQAA